ncbi:hypothetical protein J2T60_002059 [Natronospira proteinivora]|uniref:Uncharacterized protein n=1 Tax=Natronospira proteinivora TaxID=1807133 RepID=A0ABT1G9Q8_9GAMM|nr:hypothetical protein [Natronospira proteinivora]MCP1728059.1 hypothetical protein [Natronospira proteinivora]
MAMQITTARYISKNIESTEQIKLDPRFPYGEDQVLSALKGMSQFKYAGTHPQEAFEVVLTINGIERELTLYRDSGLDHMFWVKYEPYFLTPSIGYIRFSD